MAGPGPAGSGGQGGDRDLHLARRGRGHGQLLAVRGQREPRDPLRRLRHAQSAQMCLTPRRVEAQQVEHRTPRGSQPAPRVVRRPGQGNRVGRLRAENERAVVGSRRHHRELLECGRKDPRDRPAGGRAPHHRHSAAEAGLVGGRERDIVRRGAQGPAAAPRRGPRGLPAGHRHRQRDRGHHRRRGGQRGQPPGPSPSVPPGPVADDRAAAVQHGRAHVRQRLGGIGQMRPAPVQPAEGLLHDILGRRPVPEHRHRETRWRPAGCLHAGADIKQGSPRSGAVPTAASGRRAVSASGCDASSTPAGSQD